MVNKKPCWITHFKINIVCDNRSMYYSNLFFSEGKYDNVGHMFQNLSVAHCVEIKEFIEVNFQSFNLFIIMRPPVYSAGR